MGAVKAASRAKKAVVKGQVGIEEFALSRGGVGPFFEQFCKYISEGGLATKFAEKFAVDYAGLMGWIRKDEGRSKRYDAACVDRKGWQQERSVGVWTEILAKDPCIPPTHTDRLKAADALAKHSGALRDEESKTKLVFEVDLLELAKALLPRREIELNPKG